MGSLYPEFFLFTCVVRVSRLRSKLGHGISQPTAEFLSQAKHATGDCHDSMTDALFHEMGHRAPYASF